MRHSTEDTCDVLLYREETLFQPGPTLCELAPSAVPAPDSVDLTLRARTRCLVAVYVRRSDM